MSRIAYTIPEAVQIAARRHWSAGVRLALHAAYDGLCGMCGAALPSSWELDHTIPLALGGKDEPSNWQPLCPRPCHLKKTAQDRKAIAKANRLIRKADATTRKPATMQSRGFEKHPTKRRTFSGQVVSRCPLRFPSREAVRPGAHERGKPNDSSPIKQDTDTMSDERLDDFDFDDDDTCQECGGEGGYNSCMEDTCCAIGGEEGCEDSRCWRVCPSCRGKGR